MSHTIQLYRSVALFGKVHGVSIQSALYAGNAHSFVFVVAGTSLLLIAAMCFFYAFPAFAAAAKSAVAPPKLVKKKRDFLALAKKIIDGSHAKGKVRGMKIGDTRSEFSTLINIFSALCTLGAMFTGASMVNAARDFRGSLRAKKEIVRIKEYKENMYFEAVSEALAKLADPNVKGSTKSSMQKQLKELDPDGRIAKFLSDGGERPDLSDIMNNKKDKKKPVKKQAKSPPASAPKKAAPVVAAEDEDRNNGDSDNSSGDAEEDSSFEESSSYEADEVIDALFDSLKSVMSDGRRRMLRDALKSRIAGVSDETKKNAAIGKIASKLGDNDYWTAYAKKLFG